MEPWTLILAMQHAKAGTKKLTGSEISISSSESELSISSFFKLLCRWGNKRCNISRYWLNSLLPRDSEKKKIIVINIMKHLKLSFRNKAQQYP